MPREPKPLKMVNPETGSTANIAARLAELGIVLPTAAAPAPCFGPIAVPRR
jgi:hypothetical protein